MQLSRTGTPHSAFGLGVHRCIGSHVARLEMRIALEVWHERIADYKLPDDFVENYRYGSFMSSCPASAGRDRAGRRADEGEGQR